MIYRKVIFIALLFLFCKIEYTVGQELYFEKIKVENLTIDSPIQNITRDSIGYIWIGTWNGLFRYDGKNFDVYKHNPNNYNSIPDSKVKNVITDNKQRLWYLTYENKHIQYNYSTNEFVIIKDSLILKDVSKLLNSNSNILNEEKRINGKQYFLRDNHLAFCDDLKKDTLILVNQTNIVEGLPDDNITCYYIDKQDIIWIGTEKGDVYKATNNRLPFHQNLVLIQKNNRLVQCQVSSMLVINNEIWIGTSTNGIQIKSDNGEFLWNHPFYRSTKRFKNVLSLYEDYSGNIWIGTKEEGLWCYNPKTKEPINILNKDLPDVYIREPYFYCIAPKDNNSIWAAAYKGIFNIGIETKEFRKSDLHKLLSSTQIRDILQDENHKIWIATDGYCAYRLGFNDNVQCVDTLHFKDFTEVTDGQYEGERAYCLHNEKRGFIWVGTSEGLYRINKKDLSVKAFTKKDGLQDHYICAIEEDREGNIWVSTKQGISKIYHVDQSISNYTISDEYKDWVFMNTSSFNDSIHNLIYFGARDGYVSFCPELIKSTNGTPTILFKDFYVSGKKVHPGEKINDNVILKRIINNSDDIKLDYNSNSFAIELTSLNYQYSNINKYFYKLEGYNEDWMELNSNMATFVKVPYGKYRFFAKTISSDNVYSNTAVVNITILPPWYATNWAIAMYLLFIITILFFSYKIMDFQQKLKNKLWFEKLNAEKQEEINMDKINFFTNVSHELRTPLTLIVDPLKQILNKDLPEERKQKYISIVKDSVEHLVHLVNQILDFRKMEVIQVEPKFVVVEIMNKLKGCLQTFEVTAYSRQIRLNFNSDQNQLIGHFDIKFMEQIALNILSNSLKYTPNGGFINVSVETNVNKDRLILIFEDNGLGMSHKQIEDIYKTFKTDSDKTYWGKSSGIGMALTKKFIDLLNGDIKINSILNQGTTITVEIPFEKALKTEVVNSIEEIRNEDSDNSTIPDTSEGKNTLLIVEDSMDIQNYLSLELGVTFTIVSVFNGVDGLKKAKELMPDVIISDVMMPLMDGLEFCKKIKTNEKTSHIPVVLLTAKTTEEDQIEGLKHGADVYIPKPFNTDILKAQLKSIIENRLKQQLKFSSKMYISELESEENMEDTRFLKRAVSITNKYMEDVNFNPDFLAKQLHLSERQLYRKIKAVSGSTVNDFIKRVKMEEAANLLTSTDLKIYEISYKVGFSEASNFTRTFTKHFGCSPTEYVKTH